MTPEQRQTLEADYTFKRVAELELYPVRGQFDAAHLKEVNRRIFQDLPGLGLNEVTPGEFRAPVPDGLDWIKQRALSTVDGSFYVAYSRMDYAAKTRLDTALQKANPDELRNLKTAEFTARLAKLYVELDYMHPFSDGNSRTLRSFTRQLAAESGYDLDWDRFARSDVGRDLLYIARDRSVNELAIPHIQHDDTLRKVVHTQDRFEGNRGLPDLLRDAVRPSRAVAFEQLPEQEALREYPELKEAYKTMRKATEYFALKMPNQFDGQAAGIQSVLGHVQRRLDDGETASFSRSRGNGPRERGQELQERQTLIYRSEPGQELER
ncbi:Fic family protein [Microvirgula aerodenitrificans]|uniref:Fic family protein n=1 Tax=Microvirgula aerodenitrificans TaxID=57480 RepID=UPI00248EDA67|nr:Fic family protein [Microvirgula aerodenitrificans]